jgi:6-phosphogluconolactonase
LQIVPTLPEGYDGASTCADIQISPSGAFVYASNRGHDSIVIYRVAPRAGRLAYVGHEPTGGRIPRSFAIDPTGRFLLAANQDTDTIVTFRIDARTGKIRPTGHVAHVPTPVCVKVRMTAKPKSKGGKAWRR